MRGPIRGTSALHIQPLTSNFASWLAPIECSCIDTTGCVHVTIEVTGRSGSSRSSSGLLVTDLTCCLWLPGPGPGPGPPPIQAAADSQCLRSSAAVPEICRWANAKRHRDGPRPPRALGEGPPAGTSSCIFTSHAG